MSTKTKRITIYLTEGEQSGLRRLASQRRSTVSGLLRNVLEELLEDEEDTREGLKALVDVRGTVTWDEYKKCKKERTRGA